MNILLVYPDRDKPYFKDKSEKINVFHDLLSRIAPFPKQLTLPLLAAATPEEHNVEIIDGNIKNINFNKEYDLIGIHCNTSTAFMAYEIADEFRKHGTFVVIGGWHASALPEEAKQHADAVVIGEADETWPQLLKDFEEGNVKTFYHQNRPVDPKFIPYPRLTLYPKEKVISIQATRGCPYGCEFCSITNMKYGNVFRMRPIENVIHEIKLHPGRHFAFHDNSLTISPKYTKELFRQMKKEGIKKTFSAYANIDVLNKDEELLALAQDAGCSEWFIGFESISQETLKSIGKNTNKVEQYEQAIKKIHDYEINICGTFIFGFDTDTIDTFDKTDEFVKKNEIEFPEALILTPYPGTPIYDKLTKEKRILTKDWSKYDLRHVVFQPKNMTPEQLLNYNIELFKKWYTNRAIFVRTFKSLKKGYYPFINTLTNNYILKAWI
jgi:radical SAM superfamily enzyme YgiQ (UPF0313 family)